MSEVAERFDEGDGFRGQNGRFVEIGDCREVQKGLADNSISLVLTDPPYFMDGMGDDWDRNRLDLRSAKSGVIGSLPVGMKFDTQQGQRLQDFLYPIAVDWLRLVKPGGFVLCFSQNRLSHHSAMAIEKAGFEIRDMFAWQYEGQPKAFSQDHFIRKKNIDATEKERLIAKLGGRKTPQLKPQFETVVLGQKPKEGTFVDNWDKWETGLIDPRNPYIDSHRFPGTVIPAPKPKTDRCGHITAKPVDLMRHLIRIFTAPSGIVLDPFAGSGSMGVAALLENREFIGIEIDEVMGNRAQKRMEIVLA